MRSFDDAARVLGDLEQRVMEVLWEAAGPLAVREVQGRLGRGRLAYTTVMTTLDRLYKKRLLARETPCHLLRLFGANRLDLVHETRVPERRRVPDPDAFDLVGTGRASEEHR